VLIVAIINAVASINLFMVLLLSDRWPVVLGEVAPKTLLEWLLQIVRQGFSRAPRRALATRKSPGAEMSAACGDKQTKTLAVARQWQLRQRFEEVEKLVGDLSRRSRPVRMRNS
jgi:hypothetical protein